MGDDIVRDSLHDLFEGEEEEDEIDFTDISEEDDSPEQPVGDRLSTGVDILDRQLLGGIPRGRMVALIAPPDTQSELLVKRLVAERPTLYLTTLRPKWEVEEELRDYLQTSDFQESIANQIDVREVSPSDLIKDPESILEDVTEHSNLVIDAVNELEEEDPTDYGRFLNRLKRRLWETGSVGLCYGIEVEEGQPIGRSITLRLVDLIWQLRMSVNSQSIEHMLIISKFRGGRALTEPTKLVLTDEVRVDTSRDIA